MDTTQKKLLHYFQKLSDKKQLEIVDFVEYLYEREHQTQNTQSHKRSEKLLERVAS